MRRPLAVKLVSVCVTYIDPKRHAPVPFGLEASLDDKECKKSDQVQRFIALDLHNSYIVVGAVADADCFPSTDALYLLMSGVLPLWGEVCKVSTEAILKPR
jgi:hypothetical protein